MTISITSRLHHLNKGNPDDFCKCQLIEALLKQWRSQLVCFSLVYFCDIFCRPLFILSTLCCYQTHLYIFPSNKLTLYPTVETRPSVVHPVIVVYSLVVQRTVNETKQSIQRLMAECLTGLAWPARPSPHVRDGQQSK